MWLEIDIHDFAIVWFVESKIDDEIVVPSYSRINWEATSNVYMYIEEYTYYWIQEIGPTRANVEKIQVGRDFLIKITQHADDNCPTS